MTKIRTIESANADELRDKLPGSGVFDMMDCVVEIYCPLATTTEELEKMVKTIESMINVVDVRVSSTPESASKDTYHIEIKEVPIDLAKRLGRKEEN